MKKQNEKTKDFAAVAALFLVVVVAICGLNLGSPLQSSVEAGPPVDPARWSVFMPMVAREYRAPGRTFYVHPDGSSRGIGTRVDPVRTVMDLADRLEPGDTVVLMAATHRAGVYVYNIHGEPGNPIVIRGELGPSGGFLTLVDGSYLSVRNSTHVLVADLDMVHNSGTSSIEADPGKAGRPYTEDITWRNIRMRDLLGNDGDGAMCLIVDNEPDTDGVYNVLIEGLQCIHNSEPDSSGGNDAIYLGDWPGPYPGQYAPIDGVVIRDSWAENIGGQCVDIKPNVSNLLIENLTCLRTGRQGNTPGGIIVHGDGIEIRNSTVQDTGPGEGGIYFGDHEGWVPKNVHVHDNLLLGGEGYGLHGWTDVVSVRNQSSGWPDGNYWGYDMAAEACAAMGLECE